MDEKDLQNEPINPTEEYVLRTQRVVGYVTPDTKRRLKRRLIFREISMSDFVNERIIEYLDRDLMEAPMNAKEAELDTALKEEERIEAARVERNQLEE